MAQNIKPAAAKVEEPVAPKKSSKKMLIVSVAVVVLIAGAGGGWYAMKGKEGAHQAEEVKEAPPKAPIFVALEPFTVNLQREASDQYLQLGLTLKVFEAEYETKIKANLPEVRSKILQLLTTKSATQLLTAEGKNLLVQEIIALSNPVIGVIDVPEKKVAPEHASPEKHAPEAAATQVGEANTEAPHANATVEAAADALPPPKPAIKKPAQKKGIADVLFTSFIIQ